MKQTLSLILSLLMVFSLFAVIPGGAAEQAAIARSDSDAEISQNPAVIARSDSDVAIPQRGDGTRVSDLADTGSDADLADIGSVTKYKLWVGGAQVTTDTMYDILEDGGRARFDPATNTLTLNNPNIKGFSSIGKEGEQRYAKIYSVNMDLTIRGRYYMPSDEEIKPHYGIYCNQGKLTLNGDFLFRGMQAAVCISGAGLTISGGSLEAYTFIYYDGCDYVIYADKDIEISSDVDYVIAKGGIAGICSLTAIEIHPPLEVITPKDGKVKGGYIYKADGKFLAYHVAIGRKCTVTFNPDDGSGEMESENHPEGTAYTLPECDFTPPEGKRFAGWSFDGSTYQPGESITVNGDVELRACWKKPCTITFSANGGSGTMKPLTVAEGSTFTLPECTFTPPEEMTFGYWKISGQLKKRAPGDTITVSKDITIYPNWRGVLISFDANGGSGTMEPVEVKANSTYAVPECTFVYLGKRFDCWRYTRYTSLGKVTENCYPGGGTIRVYALDITLIARWEDTETYRVTIDYNGASINSETYEMEPGKYYTLPEFNHNNGLPEGKVFDCWTINGKEYHPGDKIFMNRDYTVYAQWRDNYTITFDPNGGSGTMAPVKVTNGSSYTLPGCTFTPPAGKAFDKWRISGVYRTYAPGDKITVTDNITVTAVWKALPVVDKAGCEIPGPAAGETPADIPCTALDTAAYTADILYWKDYWDTKLSSSTKFKEDATYTARVKFTPKDGYVFSDSLSVTINGKLPKQIDNTTYEVTFKVPKVEDFYSLTVNYACSVDDAEVTIKLKQKNGWGYMGTRTSKGKTGSVTFEDYCMPGDYIVEITMGDDFERSFEVTVKYDTTITYQLSLLLLGDVDGDGEVTIIDATYIQRVLADLPVQAYNAAAADTDRDGEVTILDATNIQRYIAGLSAPAGIGKPM